MGWIGFDKRRVLFEHKLSNVKIRWLVVGKEGTAHDNTFKNLKNSAKQLL